MQRFVILSMMVLFTHVHASAQVQGQVIKVLSYNIHHGENTNGVQDISGIANVILATNPDLVALQEVDSCTNRVKKQNLMKELADQTGMYVYFGKAMNHDGGGYGNGILSRYPIEQMHTVPLPAKTEKGEPRCAAIVTVKLPGDSLLQFASTHLDHLEDPVSRAAQIQILLQHVSNTSIPLILAGDLNAAPTAKEIAPLKTIFFDASEKLGPTWPSTAPTKRLDYILLSHKARWELMNAVVLEETVASDHRPVICDLLLKE